MVKAFVERHPLLVSLLLALASFGIAAVSISVSREPVVSDVQDVAPQDLIPPTQGEQALSIAWSTENLFWGLVILITVGLLTWFGWWREAGFGWPPRRRNLRLLVFPALVGVLALSNGVELRSFWVLLAIVFTVLVVTFGEEALFRGLMLRLLVPSGVVKAMLLTAGLAGCLRFGASTLAGPWPEAVQATVLSTCGGFTYAALRWRTASLWPVFFLHVFVALALVVSTPGAPLYLALLLLSTLGFVVYGLLLLRNPSVRADGGPKPQDRPVRAR